MSFETINMGYFHCVVCEMPQNGFGGEDDRSCEFKLNKKPYRY